MKSPRLWQVLVVSCMCSALGAAWAHAQTPLTPLHTFTSTPNSLIQNPDGNFYGTSGIGAGSIFFRMTPDGTFTPLRTFTSAEGGGQLVLGADGNFYGTTPGVHDPFAGRINANAFRLTPSGSLSNVAPLFGRDQFRLQGSDGYLYAQGMGESCGAHCVPTSHVYRMSASGRVTGLLGHFTGTAVPFLTIDTEGTDGNFYGSDYYPNFGRSGATIYRVAPAPSRTVSTIYTFTGGADGSWGFVQFQAADAMLYGTTTTGGTARIGSIFRLTTDGALSVLHSFAGGAADGASPTKLIEATDGNFYGITTQGGPANLGMVFQLTPAGDFTVVHAFDASEGSPQSLLQGIDGSFYGTTATLAWKLPGPALSGVAPDAPAGLTSATPVTAVPHVALTWTGAAGATSYLVKRGTAPGAETIIAAAVKFPRWNDLAIVAGTRYYYVVSAVNGNGESANSNEVSAVVRPRAGDFNADGVTDLLVYRPSDGRWYNRETGLVTALGQNGDVPLPGDYDGDGINDLAVFRPSTANWIILQSSTGAAQTLTFGVPTDAPVPGDYDGDGKFDLAVYRPATGIWYLWHSSTNTIVRWALGVGADIPVPADYDGDQIVDVAVYRPSTGMWYIRTSSTGSMTAVTFQWGVPGDRPVPGDYDGDGQSDVAVFRPSTGEWLVRPSSTGTLATRVLGTASDVLVPADYDGDGRVDLAIFRPSGGPLWDAVSLATGVHVLGNYYGLPGDIPAPHAATRNAIAVIAATPPVSTVANLVRGGDFDTDGRGDLTVYRPSTGAWFTRRSHTEYTTSTATTFGTGSDTPVPGDYDGDGTTDRAVYTPSSGQWAIALTFGGVYGFQWGLDGDVPVPADYDGDGRTDLAVFRPVNGVWYIVQSSSNNTTSSAVQWGLNGDVPAPADYDGDGITDLAVFRPSTGVWHILGSSTGFTTSLEIGWGLSGDIVVPGDYDGDARADLAVFRPANGVWYILTSSSGFATPVTYQWGLTGDIPVPSDYDGDGRTDPAVHRPASGEWYLLKSSSGFTASSVYQWGLPGDVPIYKRP